VTFVIDPPSPPPASESRRAAAADVAALKGMLATLRRQTRGWIWVESLAWLCLSAAAFFWASLAIDWSVEPPRWARAVLLAAAATGLAVLLARKLLGRLATDLGDASLAVVVERAHPSFRDSLSTTIELADQPAADINPELLARTAAEATAHLGQVRPARIFRRRQLAMLAFAAVAAVASIAGLAMARPLVAGLWVRRLPLLGDEPWPRQVQLAVDDFPGGVRKVARGSDVDVIVHAQAADRLPEVVDLRWRAVHADGLGQQPSRGLRGNWRVDRMGSRGGVAADGQAFGHVLKAVNDSLELEVRGGDAKLRNLRLEVLDPPALEKLRITSTPPAYLGSQPRESPPVRIVQIPRGSAVEIACTCTKPLSEATMVASTMATTTGSESGGSATETLLATFSAAELAAGAGPPSAAGRTIVGRIPSLDADRTIVVRFTDTDGLVNREPVTFTLSALPDEPPQVAMRLRGISTAVTPRARVPLVGTISDDHGLGEAAVRLKVADGVETSLPVARVRAGEAVVELPAESAEVVQLEPLELAVGRKLELAVTATDTCTLGGEPNAGTSDVWSLDVVAPETLVAMLEAREILLRRRYESCVADLTQARDGFASPVRDNAADGGQDGGQDIADAAGRLGDATARAAGETAELAESFRGIRLEFDNNQLITPELEARLIAQIADPLSTLAVQDLPALAKACRGGATRQELVRRADEVLARMRAVLDKMMELESFNEVVERLRGMIRSQEQIRAETLEQQKRRAREALERP
jgi:hypothetical protein